MKRKVFFPVLAVAIIAAGLMSTNLVSAQDAGSNSLVAAIATKFNLNQADVQTVFDSEKSKRQAEMKQQVETRLTQAVIDGKITEAQKQAISTHFTQMKENRPTKGDFHNLTEEQRKVKMDEKKAEMDSFLSQNGLTRETLQGLMGHGGKGFGRGGMMH